MVHVDIHTLFRVLKQVRTLLKPGGMMMLSVANLCSDLGFDRFQKQSSFKVAGFYFMSPDIIRQLVLKANFNLVELKSDIESSNLYYKRDLCLLIQKPLV